MPAVGWRFFRLNPLVGFLDRLRPDQAAGRVGRRLVGKPADKTGLGLGDGVVSGLALIAFVALVAYFTVTRGDIQEPAEAHRGLVPDAVPGS